MATTGETIDQVWKSLVDLEPAEIESQMIKIFHELDAMPDEERQTKRLAMAQAESSLTDEELRKFTVCRLRAWLQLDPAMARRMSGAYDDVMKKISGTQAMRQVGLIQTLAREFSLEDQETLVALVPNVFGGAPIGLSASKIAQEPPPPPVESSAQPAKKKWWWPFG